MVVQDTEPEESLGLTAYRVMFECAPEGVFFSTPDGRVSAANPAACTMFAMSEEEMRQCGRKGIFDPVPDLDKWLTERARTGAGYGQTRVRRADGALIEIEVQSRLFHDTDGTLMSFSVIRDITSRVETERAIEELSARLDQVSLSDELTGLANRRGLVVHGSSLLERADNEHAVVQALYVGVHNVEFLNAQLGEGGGDAALQAVARALAVAFGPHDVLARVAGTGFVALAFGMDEADRLATEEQMHDHLGAPETVAFVGAEIDLSLGWVSRGADEHDSLEELIAQADRAMRAAR
jgi:diguanylate cyclase (GGDEF)-like protein/PAS domain S-box-containing protein